MGAKSLNTLVFSDRTKKYAEAIRLSMLATMKRIKPKDVAVFLSSGVDSNACLAAALEAGKNPTIYSATINGIQSQDYISAKRTAALFDLPFVGIDIKVDEKYVKSYLGYLFYDLLPDIHKNKTTVETSFIVFELLLKVKQSVVIAGFYGDAYFATLRSLKKEWEAGRYPEVIKNLAKLEVHGDNPKDIQEMLRRAFIKDRKLKTKVICPYVEPSFIKAASGMDPFLDGCKPIQKAPLRYAFFHFFLHNEKNVRIHVAMQKGAIAADALFEKILIPSDWNTRELKSVKGIYNDLETKDIKRPRGLLFASH